MALSELKEHCRERSESSNLGFDEEFDELSQVVSMKMVVRMVRMVRMIRTMACMNQCYRWDGSKIPLLATSHLTGNFLCA